MLYPKLRVLEYKILSRRKTMIDPVFYDGCYYLEVGDASEDVHKMIVYGILMRPKETEDTGCAWGYLIYQDMGSERQRIVSLDSPPIKATREKVECISQRGERFLFSYLDYDTWISKARHIVSMTPEKKAQLNSTEAIQAFFLSLG
jgi:hypothetical protein